MPKHYDDGRIFRLRSNPTEGPELTFRLTQEELQALRAVNQSTITSKQRALISDLVQLLVGNDALDERLNQRFARIVQDGPHTHNIETSVKAKPKKIRWKGNLADCYKIIADSGANGVTDEEGGFEFARRRNRPNANGIGNTWRPSRLQLVKAGLVKHDGRKRELVSGHKGKVWIVTNPDWTPPEENQYLQIVKDTPTEHGRAIERFGEVHIRQVMGADRSEVEALRNKAK